MPARTWADRHQFAYPRAYRYADTRTGTPPRDNRLTSAHAVQALTGFPARFEPSKVTGWTLAQHLDHQLARLILEKKGAYGWVSGTCSTFRSRYQAIITQHLITRTQKLWMYVFYIVPDPQVKRAIERMFNSVKYAIVSHQRILLEAKHRDVFRVYTFAELKGLQLGEEAKAQS